MRRLTAMAMLLALVAVACKIETNVAANLNADGSGTVTFEIGFDEEAATLLQGEDPTSDFPAEAQVTQVERDGLTYYQASLAFADAEELTELMLNSDQAPFDTFSVSFSDTSVTVNATASGANGLVDEGQLELFSEDQIADSFSASVRITMPGKVISSNADSTDGSTLVWAIPLFGGDLNISAQSDPSQPAGGSGGVPAWLIGLIVVALAAGAYFLYQRGRRPAITEPPAADAPGAPPATPDADDQPAPPPPPAE